MVTLQNDDITSAAADVVAHANSLEAVAYPFLELLHGITGLDSTYLTEIDWARNVQSILYARNTGTLNISEGTEVDWDKTLCREALESDTRYIADVSKADLAFAPSSDFPLKTYLSVPVIGVDETIVGTLCGASDKVVSVDEKVLPIMEMFAKLIAQQWERDRAQVELHERAERAERQLRERATFLAEAEHMLKSPLTVIKGWASLLEDSWGDMPEEERLSGVRVIGRSTDQLVTQVDDLLDQARSEVLLTDLDLRARDIAPTFERIAQDWSATATGHNVVVEYPEHLYACVDDAALWQVLSHLVENAVKYSPNGGTIGVTASSEGDFVRIAVTDEGLGIPTEVDIFAPFMRSSRPEFKNISGSGVGLHIVRSLVLAMDGTVMAERNEDSGSTFTVTVRSVSMPPPVVETIEAS